MALTKCKECGGQVSTTANACPHCGAKVPKQTGGCGLVIGWLIIAFFLMMLAGSFIGRNDPSTRAERLEPVSNSAWDGSVYQVERYLKDTLKDPDSYQSIDWGKVLKTPDNHFKVRHTYRARNGFGGYVVEEKVFTLDSTGRVISSASSEEDALNNAFQVCQSHEASCMAKHGFSWDGYRWR